MVVVPALAIGQQRYPPTVRRQVRDREIPVPKPMAGRVHKPGRVIAEHQPNTHAPHNKGPASCQEKQNRQRNGRPDKETAQKAVERDAEQIWRVTLLESLHRLFGGYPEEPEHVTPPEALTCAVRVAGLVGILVVPAMLGYPMNGFAFEGAKQGQRVFQGARAPERPMGEQAVITDANPEAATHSVEQEAKTHGGPARLPHGRHGPQVDAQEK